jgi:predicted outer membrane repeat protein
MGVNSLAFGRFLNGLIFAQECFTSNSSKHSGGSVWERQTLPSIENQQLTPTKLGPKNSIRGWSFQVISHLLDERNSITNDRDLMAHTPDDVNHCANVK